MTNPESDQYSVAQFFADGFHEYVRRDVSPQEAVKAFHHYTHNVASQLGIVTKVIITDGGDCTCRMWEYGKGIT